MFFIVPPPFFFIRRDILKNAREKITGLLRLVIEFRTTYVPPRDPAAFLVVSQGEFQRATQAASLFSVSGRTPVSARRAGYAEIGTSEVGVFLYKNGITA
jgi:hypothetical protein